MINNKCLIFVSSKSNLYWYITNIYTYAFPIFQYSTKKNIRLSRLTIKDGFYKLATKLQWNSLSSLGCYIKTKNDTQVRLQPRELSEFHQFIESGKSDILLGSVLNDRKCIGINVTNIPIKITPI